MTSKERLETAWLFQEPDRVPVELQISQRAREHPRAKRLLELIAEHADNFCGAPGYDWGFMGHAATYSERILEERPGEFIRRERAFETPAGRFSAITREPLSREAAPDWHWEKRYICSPDDIRRVVETRLEVRAPDRASFDKEVAKIGDTAVAITGIWHPLGWLVRNATMEEVYIWFRTHRPLMHRFLEVTNDYVASVVEKMMDAGVGPCFAVTAHEMMIPPWAGPEFFEEFIFPYDKHVNDVIHRHGGKLRIHCHGNAMGYLERFSQMGVDSIEPLEGPPMGDCDLAEAKRLVGDRMLLSGNVPSPYFTTWSRRQVEDSVRRAIRAAAEGGGFSLRTTGGDAGTNSAKDREQLAKIIDNCEAYLLAGLEYGTYPISSD